MRIPFARQSRAHPRWVLKRRAHLLWTVSVLAAGAIAANPVRAADGPPDRAAEAAAPAVPPSVLPVYAAPGFMSALKPAPAAAVPPLPAASAPPAGAEFRATVDLTSKLPVSEPAPVAAPATPALPAPPPEAARAEAPLAIKPTLDHRPSPPLRRAEAAKSGGVKAPAPTASNDSPEARSEAKSEAKVTATKAPPAEPSRPAAAQAATPDWPKLLPQQGGGEVWSEADVNVARARCTQLLKQIDAVYVPEPSVRDGECGTAAPIRLVSIGRKPEVSLSPPALLTCDMVVALHDWVRNDLQPGARKILGTEIVKIEAMSDYSCRNAYGRARTRLSEHGRANALDIRGFITAKGQTAYVLEDWGRTTREIASYQTHHRSLAARTAPAKGAAPRGIEPASSGITVAAPAVAPPAQPGAGAGAAATAAAAANAVGVLTRATIADGISRARSVVPGAAADASQQQPAITFDMARLGGPKPAVDTSLAGKKVPLLPGKGGTAVPTLAALPPDAVPSGGDHRKALFLRHAHVSACRIFGTVLGPEANNAHRNHLHVDMAQRTAGAFCE